MANNTITITYALIWRFKRFHNYKVTRCKKVFNTKTNRQLKSSLNGGSIGYWIGGEFVVKSKLNQELEKDERIVLNINYY